MILIRVKGDIYWRFLDHLKYKFPVQSISYLIISFKKLKTRTYRRKVKRNIKYDPTTPGGLSGNPIEFRSLLDTLTWEYFPRFPLFPRSCLVSHLGKDEHLWVPRSSRSEGVCCIPELLRNLYTST